MGPQRRLGTYALSTTLAKKAISSNDLTPLLPASLPTLLHIPPMESLTHPFGPPVALSHPTDRIRRRCSSPLRVTLRART